MVFQSFTVGLIPIDSTRIVCCDTLKDHKLMLQILMRNTRSMSVGKTGNVLLKTLIHSKLENFVFAHLVV
jgi:hypothetical protein